MVKLFYAQALRRTNKVAAAIKVLKRVRLEHSQDKHGEASNYLGDCYLQQFELATRLASALKATNRGQTTERLQPLIEMYRQYFDSGRKSIEISYNIVKESAKLAQKKGKIHFVRQMHCSD